MLTKLRQDLVFHLNKLYSILIILFGGFHFTCTDADYALGNKYDPSNMDLNPPALFFHPYEINASLGSQISVELYGYKLNPAAAAQLDIRYDWGSLKVDSVVAGPFFTGNNDAVNIIVDEQGVLDVFLYYLPDMESNESDEGTWSLATIYFSTLSTGESELLYGGNTQFRDAQNDTVRINDYGTGLISVE